MFIRKVIGISIIVAFSAAAHANIGKDDNPLMKEQERERFFNNVCGERREFSPLFGGPENYRDYYPKMGRFAADIHSVFPLEKTAEAISPIFRDAAKRRKELIVSRSVSRQLQRHGKETMKRHQVDDITNGAYSRNERKIRESLEYISRKAISKAEKKLEYIEVKVPINPSKNYSEKARNGTAMSRNNGSIVLTHRDMNALSLLEGCRDNWNRVI